jgi:AcrR family transcriptional regulator
MTSRVESAAGTRRALLDAARELLNEGGPQKVTLREVGARADVSRGAAYRHFADKESLLAVVGAESWDRVTEALSRLPPASPGGGAALLRAALDVLGSVARDEPEVYRRMFTVPTQNPDIAIHAAVRAQVEFVRIVATVVGEEHAHLYGAMLLTCALGIASMESTGQLSPEMWETTPDDVVVAIVGMIADRR